MVDRIDKLLQAFGVFSDKDLAEVAKRLKELTIRKGDFLITEGQVCQSFFFIDRGCFRQYELLETGNEHTLNLFIPDDWMLEYKSFMTQQPAGSNIQAIEDSRVFQLTIWDLHELIRMSEAFFRIGRIMELAVTNQAYKNPRLSPEEKYVMLLANKPRIIQRFPLKYIASYLEITPETLSRVRRKLIS